MFLDLIRNTAFYVLSFFYCCCGFVPLLILLYIPHTWPYVKIIYCSFLKISSKFLLFFTFLPVTYQGFDRLPPGPVIFVANHQSALDILLIENVIGAYPCVWVAKSELLDYPIINQLAFRNLIPVPLKTSPELQRKSVVSQAVARIKDGYSVMIFPEGSRFIDGTIHSFFSGFAAIAKETGVPVVTLFISGTGMAFPSGARMIRKSPLTITVGPIFSCEKEESVADFKERVFAWFAELNWRRDYLLERYGIRICKDQTAKTALLQDVNV